MRFLLPALFIAVVCFGAVPVSADTINHVEAQANILGVQSFDAGFDWDVTTQSAVPLSASIVATGPNQGPFPFFETIGNNFADWYGTAGAFQIDIRPFFSVGDLLNFDQLGTFDAAYSKLEFYGSISGVAGGAFGSFYGLTGQMTITGPVETPEPTTLIMLLAGLLILASLRLSGERCNQN